MSPLVDFAALSLLPLSWHGPIAEHLRAGLDPRSICERLLSERPLEDGRTVRELYAAGAFACERARLAGIEMIPWCDPAYPPQLAAIADPPPLMWLRGARGSLSLTAVAIVGSRAGSPYAIAVAEQLAADLGSRGIAIVSGLARGVDAAAHRGALSADAATVAVLGCGADLVYPAEHKALAAAISRGGALASELAPGTPPQPHFFPRRNRIISGLSRAIVVIEAGEKSGSLITARCALEQGRDVLAVPGNVLNGRNRGGHALLRDGAKIVESADDILAELGIGAASHGAARQGGDGAGPADAVLAAVSPGEPSSIDEICERTGLDPAKLLPRLFGLEMQGAVRRAGGGRFVRVDRTC